MFTSKNSIAILLALGIIILSGFILVFMGSPTSLTMGDAPSPGIPAPTNAPATSTTPTETPAPVPPKPDTQPPQSSTVGLGETKTYGAISITPRAVEEDSRCPIDVVCIQAGTVRLSIDVRAAGETHTEIVKLDEKQTIAGHDITLTDVWPVQRATGNIATSAYRFTFTVTKTSPPATAACYVGGCSSEVCSDRPDIASNCMYREEYACYKTATCERQSNGSCGWTQTPALTSCIANAR